jgi:glycine/D-amino acid oxidase-like deaminating enzyme
MSAEVEAEVCVIGGGVMGAFTALALAEANIRVILVERQYPGAGASGANPGTVAVQNKHFGAIPLVLESLRRWQGLSERLGAELDYERRGGFRVAETDADVEKLERDVAEQRAAGVETEIVPRARLEREAKYLGPSVQAASYCADDGLADSLKTIRALLRRLHELRVEVWSGCRASRIDAAADHDFRVATERGTVRARWTVCAAAAWTPQLLAPLGVALPLQPEVMIASITDQAPAIFSPVLTHVRGHLTLKQQRVSGKVLIGGGWHGDHEPATGRHRVNAENLKANLMLAVSIVPTLASLQVIRAWSGLESRSPDRLLVIGPVDSPRGLFVLCAAAGGFTISPFAGELAARWILSGDPQWPIERYHVQRFNPIQQTVPTS